MKPIERVEINPQVLQGKPVIRGTRIPVAWIGATVVNCGTVLKTELCPSGALPGPFWMRACRYGAARRENFLHPWARPLRLYDESFFVPPKPRSACHPP